MRIEPQELGGGGTLTIMFWITDPFRQLCKPVTVARIICDEDKAKAALERWAQSNQSFSGSNHIECYWQSDRRHI